MVNAAVTLGFWFFGVTNDDNSWVHGRCNPLTNPDLISEELVGLSVVQQEQDDDIDSY